MDEAGMGTKCVRAGESEFRAFDSTLVPIVQNIAYAYPDVDSWLKVALDQSPGHIYSRNTNPTVQAFEAKIRELEGAEDSTSFASGMAAISNTLLALLSPGDRAVSIKDSYGGTYILFTEILPRLGVNVTLCDSTDHEAIETAIAGGCQMVYLETPTNPVLKVVDIARIGRAASQTGVPFVVDNTAATPINQNPLSMGADLVIHSASKSLSGHADVLGGALCGRGELVRRVFGFREVTGACMDPNVAYLLLRGMKTLHLRVEAQNGSALRISRFLEDQPQVIRVFYPGLESHPGHEIARSQMRGYGGMLSFELRGGFEAVKNFLPRLQYADRAANLGSVETLAGPPATTSHVECTPEERAAVGIPEGLVRYSVGIEDPDDLERDLANALESLAID
jgi:cystathionine gamma-synthase